MISKLNIVTILVHDQEKALAFYTEKLGLEKRSDQMFGPSVRWVTVAPKGQSEVEIVLQKPEAALHGEQQAKEMTALVGKNPTWSFGTSDCRKTYETLKAKGVKFVSPPTKMPYGVEAIFLDLYSNSFSLLEPAEEG